MQASSAHTECFDELQAPSCLEITSLLAFALGGSPDAFMLQRVSCILILHATCCQKLPTQAASIALAYNWSAFVGNGASIHCVPA
jgi:hypothetical protein